MCRNIRTLFNFEPPVTEDEIRAASLQFVRKITGFNKPSKANEEAFNRAIDEVARISSELLTSLESTAPPKIERKRPLRQSYAQSNDLERSGRARGRRSGAGFGISHLQQNCQHGVTMSLWPVTPLPSPVLSHLGKVTPRLLSLSAYGTLKPVTLRSLQLRLTATHPGHCCVPSTLCHPVDVI